jgi:carbohydrate diacid regulator
MQLDSRIVMAVSDIAQHIELETTLLDETGEVLISSNADLIGTMDPGLESAEFENGIAHVEEVGKTYFLVENDNYRPLRLVLGGINTVVDRYGFLSVSIIDEILRTTLKKPGREDVFRRIMLDRIDPLELQEAIRDFHIDPESSRCVVIIQTFNGDASKIYDALLKIFPRQLGDTVVNFNRYVVALVKQVDEEGDMDTIVQMVQAIDETIINEMSLDACLGVGSIKKGLVNIRDSFREAQEAINLGLTQQNQGRVFLFQRLLLERFLQEVPRDLRRQFYELAFNDSLKKVLNEEMLVTITKFFENNLNLSEAARKLYIHRNTLIYRLDKIQKVTGLDLRRFEDAVLLKIIIMLGKSLSSNNRLE